MKEEILELINRRFDIDCRWTTGNCYWFAKILTSRFPQMEICYCPIEGHFVSRFKNEYYDANGVYEPIANTVYLFETLKEIDPPYYNRLIRDCVM